jgi:hypothetical protein
VVTGLTHFEQIRLTLLERRLGVLVTKYTAEEWLAKAVESEAIAKSGRADIDPLWWAETMRYQLTAAEFAEKLAVK